MKTNNNIYYSNDCDKVVSFKEKPIIIDENYKYLPKKLITKIFAWISYRLIATPFAFITFKLINRVKFFNIDVLKKFKNDSYFIYANHTNQFCDGFCPALICFPQKPHIIVNPANVSIPLIGKLNKIWGGLPLPNNIKATKNFYNALETVINSNNPILIYPEANLWPYYTKIRNFPNTSFRYPIKYNKPVFTFTTVYKKRKHFKRPKIEVYVDGPFYPNRELNEKEAQENLRNVIFEKLNERSCLNNYEYVKYIKRSEKYD